MTKKITAILLAFLMTLCAAFPVLAAVESDGPAESGKLDWTVMLSYELEDPNDTSGNIEDDYNQQIEAGKAVEKKYLQDGPYSVTMDKKADENSRIRNYYIYYPEEISRTNTTYPLLVMVNGTGITARKYLAIFRHLASWGFIVTGCDDPTAWDGWSGSKCLNYVLQKNEDPKSIFYHHVDTENIGVDGHSQGGVGAINAATNFSNSGLYKAVISESCVSRDISKGLGWPYDASKLKAAALFFAGTEMSDSEIICPLKDLKQNYNDVNNGRLTAMARVVGAKHGDVLTGVEGYRTAWFCYLLKGDQEAGKAFTGKNPELLSNPNFSDAAIKNGGRTR